MPSLLLLPPPTKRQRIIWAGTGVVALLVAGTLVFIFTESLMWSFTAEKVGAWDFVATGFTLLIAGFFCWVAWTCRLEALPFRFVVDASNRECGYRWRSWWVHRSDLSDATKLRGEMSYAITRPYCGTWTWSIYAVRREFDKGLKIYRPMKPFHNEEEAVMDCRRNLQVLSEHLLLPSEFTAYR